MPLRTLKSLVLLGFLLLSAGCRQEMSPSAQRTTAAVKDAVECPAVEDVAAQSLTIFLFDRSALVGEMAQIRTDLVQLVQRLPAPTQLFGAYIADNTSTGEVWLRDAIPAEPSPVDCKPRNPFDYAAHKACQRQQHRYEAQRACVTAARERIITTLQRLTPVPTPRPDVWGAMAVAAEMFSAYPPSGRLLIVYSPLNDTIHSQVPKPLAAFQDAKVLVRMPRPALGEHGPQRLAAFKQRLCGWGAQVAVPPFEMPWPAVFQHADRLFAAAIPVVEPPASTLAAFMASLDQGPYGVIVASLDTEARAHQEVRRIQARYPELAPSYGRASNGKAWAVSIGAFYSQQAAEALQAKAIALGERFDTFVWDTRRY